MNDYLANIIDAANEGIYVTDRERRFILWNRAAEKIAGYKKNEIIGRRCQDNILNHVDGRGQARSAWRDVLSWPRLRTGRPAGLRLSI